MQVTLNNCSFLQAELLRKTQNSRKHKAWGLYFLSKGMICFSYPLKAKILSFSVSFSSRVKVMSSCTRWFHWAYVKLHQQRMCPYCYWQTSKKEPSLLPKCFHKWMTSMWALQEKGKIIWARQRVSREQVSPSPFWFCTIRSFKCIVI